MSAEKQPSSLILANSEDPPIQSCRAVLVDLDYQSKILADPNALLNELDDGGADLLLLDAEHIDAAFLTHITQKLTDDCIPVFLLTDSAENELTDTYLSLGVDDLIVKPVNPVWLRKKLGLCKKARQLLQTHRLESQQLSAYRHMLDQEQAVAESLYDNILRGNDLDIPVIKSAISPQAIADGHVLWVGRTPDHQLHILLGRFLGGGIASTVAASPAAEIFFGMSAKGFDIVEIAQEINYKLDKLLPSDMFLAAVIVALRPDSKTLQLLNCGFPKQILQKHQGHRFFQTFPSNNPPLGLRSRSELVAQTTDVGGNDYLYLYSDAVCAMKNTSGESLGFDAIMDCLSETDGPAYDSLQARLRQHCGNEQVSRKLSFVELFCDVENVPWKSEERLREYRGVTALTWKVMMEFEVKTLKKLNPVPVIVNALMEIQDLQKHQQTIFVIVTELLANALDHGVLKLDSSIKSSAEGFMRFYELREERLQSFQQGHVRLLFEHRPTATGGRLRIKVKDSGDGFDHQAIVSSAIDENTGYAGRGIGLLKTLCSSVSYQGRGNRVTVVFDWEH